MIIVQSIFHLVPNARDNAIKHMKHMAQLCVDEAGCLSYEYFQGVTDPNQVVLLQEWSSADFLQGHYQTEHMEEFVSKLGQYLESAVITRSYVSQEKRVSQEEKFSAASEEDLTETPNIIH